MPMQQQMGQQEKPPDAVDQLYLSIPRLVHYGLGTVGAVAGWFYAQHTHDDFVMRCVILGGGAGAAFCHVLWMGYRSFKLEAEIAAGAAVLYYVVYLPMGYAPLDFHSILRGSLHVLAVLFKETVGKITF